MVKFFANLGLWGQFEACLPSRTRFTEQKINLINKTPEIEELITSLLDPREYFDSEYNLLDIVNFSNNYLRFDDYEIVDHDGYYKIYDRRKPANTPKIFKGEVKTCRLAPSGRSNIITMSNNEVFHTNIDELFEPGISIFAEAFLYKNTGNYFSGHYEVRKVPNEDIHVNDPLERKEVGMDKVDKVFIIHGHDSEMKTNVQLLLSRAKVTDVVLHECADKGRNIIDKLIEETYGATYAIALLSPDDKLEDGSIRARQNVILEIGFFLGRLGKQNVRLLVKDDVEIPSDLQGILYEKLDGNGAWKIKLLKKMKEAGINVDINEAINKF